jgi:hypothetical protein
MPMEMAGLAGTLAGVAEVARSAFSPEEAAKRVSSVPSTPRQS